MCLTHTLGTPNDSHMRWASAPCTCLQHRRRPSTRKLFEQALLAILSLAPTMSSHFCACEAVLAKSLRAPCLAGTQRFAMNAPRATGLPCITSCPLAGATAKHRPSIPSARGVPTMVPSGSCPTKPASSMPWRAAGITNVPNDNAQVLKVGRHAPCLRTPCPSSAGSATGGRASTAMKLHSFIPPPAAGSP